VCLDPYFKNLVNQQYQQDEKNRLCFIAHRQFKKRRRA
jgi:hypothetical protein